jgi:hypothetical protein
VSSWWGRCMLDAPAPSSFAHNAGDIYRALVNTLN